MKKILCKVEYVGKNFYGWQKQNLAEQPLRTVETEIETALKKILKEDVGLFVSGRTDGKVSAKGQYFHFETTKNLEPQKILIALKALLPKDISVVKAKYVDKSFDARYSAKEKEYHYMCYVSEFIDPFLEEQYLHLPTSINVRKMKKALKLFVGMKNFYAYHKQGSTTKYYPQVYENLKEEILLNKTLSKFEKETRLKIERRKLTPLRKVSKFVLSKKGKVLVFKIRGEGFLHNMVRIIVGTVIEVGQGKRSLEEIKQSFDYSSRESAGKTQDAKALVLWDVYY